MDDYTLYLVKKAYYGDLYGRIKEATNRAGMKAKREALRRGAGRQEAKRQQRQVAEAFNHPSPRPASVGGALVPYAPHDVIPYAPHDVVPVKPGRNAIVEYEDDHAVVPYTGGGAVVPYEDAEWEPKIVVGKPYGDTPEFVPEEWPKKRTPRPRTFGSYAREYAPSGGVVLGAGAGGAAGYFGSNWLSKKLGLQGPGVSKKRRYADIALRTGGTLLGAGLGGYGGHTLGKYLTKEEY